MMCMTELHGGVCHRTSTPHKSGNKMNEKKKKKLMIRTWYDYIHSNASTNVCSHSNLVFAIECAFE